MAPLLVLFLAALLEASGDAMVRGGLRGSGVMRGAWFAAGAIALFAYGCAVNSPNWNFGRLIGVYVVLFFLLAQLIGWVFFREMPSRAIVTGGALILAGGAVITCWR